MKRVTRILIAPLLVSLSFLLIVPAQSFAASDPSQGKQALAISATGDVSGLGAAKKDIKTDLQGVTYETESVTFQVDPASCFVAAAPEGYDYLGIGNLYR
jgi:hypothetical protein